jgi:hypothetical protein
VALGDLRQPAALGFLSETTRSGTIALGSAPVAGSLIVSAIVADKSAGSFTVDPDFTALGSPLPHLGSSVSGQVAYRIATGAAADQSVTWAYTDGSTVGRGARILLVEIDAQGGTFALAGSPVLNASETTRTTATVDPGASVEPIELALAVTGIDSSDNGQWGSSDPVWSGGYSTLVTGHGNTVTGSPNYNGGAGASLAVKVTKTAGTAMAATATWSQADQAFVAARRWSVTGLAAPTPILRGGFLLANATQTVIEAVGVTKDAGSTRLVWEQGTALNNPTATAAVTPDAGGASKHRVTGLTAGNTYAYRMQASTDNGATWQNLGQVQTIRTMPSSGEVLLAVASCWAHGGQFSDDLDPITFERISARNPHALIIDGDIHYQNPGTTDLAVHRAAMDTVLSDSPRLATLARKMGVWRLPSDHDTTGNGSHSGSTGMAQARQVHKERFPNAAGYVSGATGVYSPPIRLGRATDLLLVDTRTERSDHTITDGASKVIMSTAQEDHVVATLQNTSAALVLAVCDVPWPPGGPETTPDHWGGFPTAQSRMVSRLDAVKGTKRLDWLVGDAHMLAYDSGANGFGYATMCAAPIARTTSEKGGPWDGGVFRPSGRLYGMIRLADDGKTITRTFTGYNALDDTVHLSNSVQVATATTTISTLSIPDRSSYGPAPAADLAALRDKLNEIAAARGLAAMSLPALVAGPAENVRRAVNAIRVRIDELATNLGIATTGLTDYQPGSIAIPADVVDSLVVHTNRLVTAANG